MQEDRGKVQPTCTGVHNGETGRNGYTRGGKYLDEYHREVEGSAMWRHCLNKSPFRTVATMRNDATKRQILEAVRIERTEQKSRMNSRGEWGANRVPRIEITRE